MSEAGGLEDLMMGSASEEVKESDEQIQARIAAAQAKLQKVQKDEKKAKGFDGHLAKLIPQLDFKSLVFVGYLIDHEVESLVVLALLSIMNDDAERICHDQFDKFIEETADFSEAQIGNAPLEEKISRWWTYIFAADHVHMDTTLSRFSDNAEFRTKIAKECVRMLRLAYKKAEIEWAENPNLQKRLAYYEQRLFMKPEEAAADSE